MIDVEMFCVLIAELVPLFATLFSLIYGLKHFFKKGKPLFLQTITMAMGSHALGSIYHLCQSLTSDEIIENHANLMYQVDIFSNLTSGKKAECKKILKVVDEKMSEMGFVRILCEPIENLEDATIYRITARYNAIVGRKINGINQIYRNQ
jgi:hypothetical protein